MNAETHSFSRLESKRREQTPQALARLAVAGLFIGLWFVLWLASIPMPVPFLLVLAVEVLFFVVYWRTVFLLPSARAVELAQYGMLAAEIVFHTTMVYFLGGVSWLGAFAYVFGLIFANTFLDLRRGLVYTGGASLAFIGLIVLEATGTIPHYVYLEQGPLRYTDARFVTTTVIAGAGVFFSIYAWVNWVGRQLRQERDAAVRTQDDLLQARAALQRANAQLEERVQERTAALRESEERLRTVVSNAPVVLFALDRNGIFTLSDGKGLAALGLKPGEVVGLSAFDVYREVPAVVENLHRALAGEAFTATVDVQSLTFETHYTPIFDAGGEVAGVIGIATDVTERWRAEQALRESEERFRFLAEHAQDIIYRYRTAEPPGYEYVSPAITAISGYTPEQFYADPNFDSKIVHPDDREAFEQTSRYLRTDAVEFRWICKDGSIIFTEERNVLIYDETGSLVAIEGIVRDITERKRTEEALRESEAKYRQMFENVHDLFYQTDLKGTIIEISPSAERYGYTREGLIGTSVLEIYADPEERVAFVQAMMSQGHVSDYEIHLKSGDGRVIDAAVSARVFNGPDGASVGFEGVIRDISERKRAEEALRESEATLKATLESTADGVLVLNNDWRVTYINERFAQMWGFPDELVETRDVMKLLPFVLEQLEDAETVESRIRDLHDSPEESLDTLRLKDGRAFEQFSLPLRLGRGITGRVVSIRDITERKQAEQALREQARCDSLTGVLNHAAVVDELRGLVAEGDDGTSHAVAMVDVDGLKAVNDTYGHQLGDDILLAVASALSRDGAIVGRYGGDEFVAVLPGAGRAAAERYRQDVLDALAGVSLTDPESGAELPIVASIGLAIFPEEAGSVADLIKLADSGMYASRRQRPVGVHGRGPASPLGSDHAAEMVGQIVPFLTSPGELEEKLRLVAQRISVGAGYHAVNIDIYRQPSGPASARNTFSEVPDEVREAWLNERRRMDDDPFIQLLLRTRRAIIVDDPQNDERLTEIQRNVLRAAQLRSAAVVPLFWGDELIGVLSAASRRERAFTPSDVQFLTTVASQVTAIVRMATLVDELQVSSSRLAEAQIETVLLLAAAAEAHDRTTGLHLQGVRALAEALARELGHSEEDARELGFAAVLHDIGKMRVPDVVLTASGQLTDEEWELMRHHATWGAEFLAGRAGFELAATIARSHHERWDGSGYPDGLAGEAVPEAAAIVTVADSFDAMTQDRPYRARRPVAQAVEEIEACAGKQFSPRVVAALRRLSDRDALPLPGTEAPGKAA